MKEEEELVQTLLLDNIPNLMKPKILAVQYDYYLSGAITESKNYVKVFDVIRNASPNDLIILHINSPGGDLDTSIQMIRSIAESEATVIGSAEGLVASAAFLIFLSCDSFVVSDYSAFMAHTLTTGMYGKSNELHDDISFTKKWGDDLTRRSMKDFLTPQEIDQVINGKNVWLTADEVVKRLEHRNKIVEKNRRVDISRKKKSLILEKDASTNN